MVGGGSLVVGHASVASSACSSNAWVHPAGCAIQEVARITGGAMAMGGAGGLWLAGLATISRGGSGALVWLALAIL
jgi:hypothetical protein